MRARESTFSLPNEYESHELSPIGSPLDVNADLSFLTGADSYATTASVDNLLNIIAPQIMWKPSSIGSHPSDGELNRDFKFGGKPLPNAIKEDLSEDVPITLSTSFLLQRLTIPCAWVHSPQMIARFWSRYSPRLLRYHRHSLPFVSTWIPAPSEGLKVSLLVP